MDIKTLYYKIRPMAKFHSGEGTEIPRIHPAIYFFVSCFISIFIGFFGGVFLWLAVGFSPDNSDSGGTTSFLLGAVLMSTISVLVYLLNKNRWIFYGLNIFTILVCMLLLISLKR